jgi:hypothetical protein
MRWILIALLLASCSGINPLTFLGGGSGPTVNSNAQIGKENKQAVVTYEDEETNNAGRDVIQTEIVKEVEAGPVERLDITNTNIPPWVMLLLLLGWLLPTPTEIGRSISNFVLALFKRKM